MERKKRALVGAGLGALAGAGVGTYMDRQEAKLRAELDRTGVSVTRIGDNITLNMPGNVTFATDSSDLNAGFFDVLNSVSMVVNEYEQTVIEIAGHTDSTGTDAYNQQLSDRRAGAVSSYLRTREVLDDRIITVGMGEGRPVATNETVEGRQQNRRVELTLVPLTSELISETRGLARRKAQKNEGASNDAPFFHWPRCRYAGTHLSPELRDRIRLDLADALRRDVVLRGELVQGRLSIREPAAREDVAAAGVELVERHVQAIMARPCPSRPARSSARDRRSGSADTRPGRNPRRRLGSGSNDTSRPLKRCSISATSRVVTPKSLATASASSLLSQPRCFLALRRLKNSLR